jgi:K+-transporting ATPase ATPase A chain
MFSNFARVEYLHLAINLAILVMCMAPMGAYMARVYRGQATFLTPLLTWFETALYKLAGVDPETGMTWKTYALSALMFSGLGFTALYLLLVSQKLFAGGTDQTLAISPAVAFSTAARFVTNTRLFPPSSGYVISPFNQMIGLTVQNFLSAGVSISVFIAVTRGIARTTPGTIGNFWVDLVRTLLYVLLPLSLAFVLLIGTAGVGDAIEAYAVAHMSAATQPVGNFQDIAAGETLKLTMTTAGSFLNANGAHLGAVSTPLTRLLDFLSMLLIPSALCWIFGEMIKDKRQSYLIFAGAAALLVVSATASIVANGLIPPDVLKFADGNAAVLYCLVAVLVFTAAVRRWRLGRSPSYLGHKVGQFDITMAATTLLIPTIAMAVILLLQGLDASPAFAPAVDSLWGLGALFSRFWIMIPALAIAGSFSATPVTPAGGQS